MEIPSPLLAAPAGPRPDPAATDPAVAVGALYREHALGLIRLALLLTGDAPAAEDIVHDAFCGLHRRWDQLRQRAAPLPYLRAAVVNGCRSEIRRLRYARRRDSRLADPAAWSAEAAALVSEERREVLAALARLPARQREALVLRFYLELSEAEMAAAMRVTRGTVKSTTARGIAALRRILEENSR
jgi:RNA polymerase sigma-70 factor (sigma-E family)